MSKKKVCRICGKEYESCQSAVVTGYKWQNVACCPEHGAEYLALILKSREPAPEKEEATIESVAQEASVEDNILPFAKWKRKKTAEEAE